eukprot:TRINITY_DN14234_c1_g1_i1.p1 TRINITY_DN14234_c1_g1~~TRINITY_DN14234_c1_g1_i1.p1  ORF type:complete len:441 (+),score=48.72 TRINITY_DN14234_c1_g1_i1:68-1390(+)
MQGFDRSKFYQPYASKGLVDGQVRSGLNAKEKEAFDELRRAVDGWGLKGEMKEWCTEGTLCRYLRARGWDAKKAAAMLEGTVKWRRETRPDLISYKDIKSQMDSLANIVWGFDSVGHVLMYMRVSRDPPGDAQQKLDFVIHNIEESTRMMDLHAHLFPGVERLTYIIDLKNFTMENSARDMTVSKQWTHILANHCPERLHKAYLLNYPTVFKIFWMTLKPFLDPVTRSKVNWVAATTDLERQSYFKNEGIDPDWFEQEYGGNVPNCAAGNCFTKPGYKSYFHLIPAQFSPYNWAMIAGALTIIQTSSVLPIQISLPEEEEANDLDELNASLSSVPNEEIRAIWDIIHASRVEPPPPTPAPPSICVRRPTGDLRLIAVEFKTTVADVKTKADLKQFSPDQVTVHHEGSALDDTVCVYPLADKPGTVLEIRVSGKMGCCAVA